MPGFTQGRRPYGSWTARHFFVASQWRRAANDNYDVAFVTLDPQDSGGHVTHIGQVADALPIVVPGRSAEEFAFGYPANLPYSGGGLYYCSGRVTADAFHASPDSGLRCVMTAGSSGRTLAVGLRSGDRSGDDHVGEQFQIQHRPGDPVRPATAVRRARPCSTAPSSGNGAGATPPA